MSIASNEIERLRELDRLQILDTPAQVEYDLLTSTAAAVFDVPIALISLIDNSRQWFKSAHGICATETPREHAFCGKVISLDQAMVVEDASKDPRFTDNPLVTGDPNIRFYAGHPITTRNGYRVGTLCVIDDKPRTVSERETSILANLAGLAGELMESRFSVPTFGPSVFDNDETSILVRRITGAVQHQFANILSIAIGNLDLLAREGGESATRFRRLEAVRKAAERGISFTQQLSSLTGAATSTHEPINVADAMVGAHADLSATVRHGDRLKLQSIPDECWVRANPVDLNECVKALVRNAAMSIGPDGAVTVDVRCMPTSAIPEDRVARRPVSEQTVAISVTDTGSGMSEDVAAKAWEPFFTTQRGIPVLGMGLTTVRAFARNAGGDAALETNPGLGTKVTMYLPAVDGGAARRAADSGVRAEDSPPSELLFVYDSANLPENGKATQ